MKIKIQMTKRFMIVLCIIVAALSFMGGMIYKYEDYVTLIDVDVEQAKYVYKFRMPLEKVAIMYWLDWAIAYHQYYFIDRYSLEVGESAELEEHYAWIDMYKKIKILFLEFDEKYPLTDYRIGE